MEGESVPVVRHFEALRQADLDLAAERDRRYAAERAASDLAVVKAHTSAEKLADKHNDLIRASEKRDETYATKDEVGRIRSSVAKLYGGLTVLGIIGVTNLVRLWSGT